MAWFGQRWLDRRRQHDSEYADLFAPYQGKEWVSIDLETTGLDPRHDSIISLAAVPGHGQRIRLRDRLNLRIRSDSQRVPQAIRYHRLRPADLQDGIDLNEALHRLLTLLGNRPLLGWAIAFDRAMLDRALRSQFGFALPNRCIDVREEYLTHVRRGNPFAHPEQHLDAVARKLGLPVFERHTALGDAVTTAAIHCKLRVG